MIPQGEINSVKCFKIMVANRTVEGALGSKVSSKVLKRTQMLKKGPKMGHAIHMSEADKLPQSP